MPDLSGVARGKIMPTAKYCEDLGIRLPEAIILQTITGDFPEDYTAVRPSDGDMVLTGSGDGVGFVIFGSCTHL